MLQTTLLAKKSDVKREWHHIDASGVILGRLATRIAALLRGKKKRNFTPHIDGGDFVVVVNAAKVRLTGNKLTQKQHFRHSGYPGGVTLIPYSQFLSETPEKVVFHAVKGMLPKNRTRKKRLTRLRIFRNNEHTHKAQLSHSQEAVGKSQEQAKDQKPEEKNTNQ